MEVVDNVEGFIERIRRDVYFLKGQGIAENRIKISIPRFYKETLESYFYNILLSEGMMAPFDSYFGCEIVPGFNSLVCVFDDMAMPHHKGCQPFYVKFKKK